MPPTSRNTAFIVASTLAFVCVVTGLFYIQRSKRTTVKESRSSVPPQSSTQSISPQRTASPVKVTITKASSPTPPAPAAVPVVVDTPPTPAVAAVPVVAETPAPEPEEEQMVSSPIALDITPSEEDAPPSPANMTVSMNKLPLPPIGSKVLVVSDADGNMLTEVESWYVPGCTITIISPNDAQIEGSDWDIAALDVSSVSSSNVLSSVLKAIKLGAKVFVMGGEEKSTATALSLAGFIDFKPAVGYLEAAKPAWEPGAKAVLTLRKPANSAQAKSGARAKSRSRSRSPTKEKKGSPKREAAPAPVAIQSGWNMAAADGDDELVDEEALLEASGAPILPAKREGAEAGGCATKKRACKDCSCGRAELEASGEESKEDAAPSACGNCYKGDAFRCSTCPHLGKPAFEKGSDRVMLADLADDFDADVEVDT